MSLFTSIRLTFCLLWVLIDQECKIETEAGTQGSGWAWGSFGKHTQLVVTYPRVRLFDRLMAERGFIHIIRI